MKKIIILFLLIICIANLNAVDTNWIIKISNYNNDQLNDEIKYLKSELNKDKNNNEFLSMIGICYNTLGNLGEKKSNEAIKYLEGSMKINEDPVIMAYLGSAYALRGRDKLDLGAVSKGLEIIDQAYNNAKDNTTVLMIRISVNVAVPKFFVTKRIQSLKDNIKTLEDFYTNEKISKYTYANAQFLKAELCLMEKQNEKAVQIWKNIIEKFADTKYAGLSKEKLSKYNK